MSLLEKHTRWISTEVIEPLNHNLNYSRWVDTYASDGKWEIEINDQETPKKINIYMPVSEYGKPHSGFWNVFRGRFEFKGRELLVWQNEEVPSQLSYGEEDGCVTLWIYGRKITFEKKN